MSLDTSKKSQYHSALAMNSPITVKVVAGPRESQYKKKGEPGHLYVKLDFNGYVFSYGAENEGCAKPFEGKDGDVITIQASGRGEDARIEIVDGPQKAVSSAVETSSARPDALGASTQRKEEGYEDFRHALMRVLNAFWLIERGVGVESDQSKIDGFETSEAHLQAKCSTAFIHLDKLGLVKGMPDKPLWSIKAKEIPKEEIRKVFPNKEPLVGDDDF